MQPYQPSRTAEYMAYFRALESARPPAQRLFDDPFAARFLRSRFLRFAAFLGRVPVIRSLVDSYTDVRLPGARTSAIARTKLIDDSLLDAFAAGISQLVILGSGFDCRAYRLAPLDGIPTFEVDHPATLAIKLDRLRRVLSKLPDNVRYVETDFIHQSLSKLLAQAGFDATRPAIFLWEGVSQYLTLEAVDSLLRFVSSCGAGTRLVFTYVHAGMLNHSVPFKAADRLLRGYAQLGEPWIFGIVPQQASAFLGDRGLSLDRDLSADQYRALCYGKAAERMGGYEFYHTAIAHVAK